MPAGQYPEDPLSKMQVMLYRWETTNLSSTLPPAATHALGIAEEIGELSETMLGLSANAGRIAHLVLKNAQGIRGIDTETLRIKSADAIADALIFATQYCTSMRLDIGTLYRLTASKVMRRRWLENPVHAADGESK